MNQKDVAINKKAYHDYFIEDKYEAGLSLLGTEIKSVRKGKVQLKDSYVSFKNHEAFIKGMNIAQYDHGNQFNHIEDRDRKLLLHKTEIRKLEKKVQIQGYTIVPLKMYLKDSLAKLEIALVKGKTLYDKRDTEKQRSMDMEARKAMKR